MDEAREPEFLRVRNWEKYQVYKDGRRMRFFAIHVVSDPEKGVRSIFEDHTFMELADAGDCPVFRIMAVAAETGNKLPNSEKWLKMRCHSEKPVNIPRLLASGFLEPHPDSCTSLYKPVPNKDKDKDLYVGEVVSRPSKRRLPRWRSA